MPDSAVPYIAFIASLAAMLTVGLTLQSVHVQGGLIATELVCILLPAVAVYLWRRKTPGWDFPSLRRLGMPSAWLLWVVVTAAFIGIAANLVTGLLVELVPALRDMAEAYEESVKQLLYPDDVLSAVLGVVAIAIAAPVCEEALFRGAILTGQRTAETTVTRVVLINGLLFAALHVNPVTFVALVAVGAFFAHLTILTRSLWPAILAHTTLNSVNGLLVPLIIDDSGQELVEPTMLELVAGAAIVVPIVGALWVLGARRLGTGHQEAPSK